MSEPISAEMILAVDSGCGFGCRDGSLPWSRVGWDMEHFRARTQGMVMIMGSKTYSSAISTMEEDGREIIVLTNTPAKKYIDRLPRQQTAGSWHDAAAAVRELGRKPIICGGAQVNESVLHGEGSKLFRVDRVWATEFDLEFDADIYFREEFEDFHIMAEIRKTDPWSSGKILILERNRA